MTYLNTNRLPPFPSFILSFFPPSFPSTPSISPLPSFLLWFPSWWHSTLLSGCVRMKGRPGTMMYSFKSVKPAIVNKDPHSQSLNTIRIHFFLLLQCNANWGRWGGSLRDLDFLYPMALPSHKTSESSLWKWHTSLPSLSLYQNSFLWQRRLSEVVWPWPQWKNCTSLRHN